jgi:hypothetical protein
MGELPAHGMAASRHAALDDMACLEQGAQPRAFGSMPVALARVLYPTADCLLRTGNFPVQQDLQRTFRTPLEALDSILFIF